MAKALKPKSASEAPAGVVELARDDGGGTDFEVSIHSIVFLQDGAETDNPVRSKDLTVEGAATPDSADKIVTVTLTYSGPGAPAPAVQASAVAGGGWSVTFAAPGAGRIAGGSVNASITAFGVTASTVRSFTYGMG
jgi:hypothetical protein